MRFHLSNDYSISLWDSEFISIHIDEKQLSYVRPDRRKVIITLPQEWLKGCINEREDASTSLTYMGHNAEESHNSTKAKSDILSTRDEIVPESKCERKNTSDMILRIQTLERQIQTFEDKIKSRLENFSRLNELNTNANGRLNLLTEETSKLFDSIKNLCIDIDSLNSSQNKLGLIVQDIEELE